MRNLGIYIHWPFCKQICHYCNFNKYPVDHFSADDIKTIGKLLLKETQYYFSLINPEDFILKSIFFGGGTPSLMSDELIYELINSIKKQIQLDANLEITCEMNPDSTNLDKLKNFSQAGINRISLGVQSFIEDDLKILGRAHGVSKAIQAIIDVRNVYENYSIDLISNRHMQSYDKWENELMIALKLNIPHISMYNLSIEKNTKFYKLQQKKQLKLPNDNDSYLIDNISNKMFIRNKYKQYEISNFAKHSKFESIHNKIYWNIHDYIGIGPGAHGRISIKSKTTNKIERYETENKKNIYDWKNELLKNNSATSVFNKIDYKNQINELLIMSLRLAKGFNVKDFYSKFGISITHDLFKEIQSLEKLKLLKTKTLRSQMTQSKNSLYSFDQSPLERDFFVKDVQVSATKKGTRFLNKILRQLII